MATLSGPLATGKGPTPAPRWEVAETLPDGLRGAVEGLAIVGEDSVVAAGSVLNGFVYEGCRIACYGLQKGEFRWQRIRTELNFSRIQAGPDGDVWLTGGALDYHVSHAVVVMKMDGKTGRMRWTTRVPYSLSSGTHAIFALSPKGDAYVALANQHNGQPPNAVVARIRGSDGTVLWNTLIPLPGTYLPGPLGVTFSEGDVIFSAERTPGSHKPALVLTRLNDTDGKLLWTTDTADGVRGRLCDRTTAVTVKRSVGVFTIDRAENGTPSLWIRSISHTTGKEEWSVPLRKQNEKWEALERMWADDAGDVYMVSISASPGPIPEGWDLLPRKNRPHIEQVDKEVVVRKYRATDGMRLWEKRLSNLAWNGPSLTWLRAVVSDHLGLLVLEKNPPGVLHSLSLDLRLDDGETFAPQARNRIAQDWTEPKRTEAFALAADGTRVIGGNRGNYETGKWWLSAW